MRYVLPTSIKRVYECRTTLGAHKDVDGNVITEEESAGWFVEIMHGHLSFRISDEKPDGLQAGQRLRLVLETEDGEPDAMVFDCFAPAKGEMGKT